MQVDLDWPYAENAIPAVAIYWIPEENYKAQNNREVTKNLSPYAPAGVVGMSDEVSLNIECLLKHIFSVTNDNKNCKSNG